MSALIRIVVGIGILVGVFLAKNRASVVEPVEGVEAGQVQLWGQEMALSSFHLMLVVIGVIGVAMLVVGLIGAAKGRK